MDMTALCAIFHLCPPSLIHLASNSRYSAYPQLHYLPAGYALVRWALHPLFPLICEERTNDTGWPNTQQNKVSCRSVYHAVLNDIRPKI